MRIKRGNTSKMSRISWALSNIICNNYPYVSIYTNFYLFMVAEEEHICKEDSEQWAVEEVEGLIRSGRYLDTISLIFSLYG